jgi:hypothetical protein
MCNQTSVEWAVRGVMHIIHARPFVVGRSSPDVAIRTFEALTRGATRGGTDLSASQSQGCAHQRIPVLSLSPEVHFH